MYHLRGPYHIRRNIPPQGTIPAKENTPSKEDLIARLWMMVNTQHIIIIIAIS